MRPSCQHDNDPTTKGKLTCTVCLELPPNEVYQCSGGHLLCSKCFGRISEVRASPTPTPRGGDLPDDVLSDAGLTPSEGSCPICRVSMAGPPSRNHAAEAAISRLSAQCRHCGQTFTRAQLLHHQAKCLPKFYGQCRRCGVSVPPGLLQTHEASCPPQMYGITRGSTLVDNSSWSGWFCGGR